MPDYYYTYADRYSFETGEDTNNAVQTSSVVTKLGDTEINGSVTVVDQTSGKTVDIGKTSSDQMVVYDFMTINSNAVTSNKPVVVSQQNTTDTDGLQLKNGSNVWKIYVDSSNNLTFKYNGTIVQVFTPI